MCPKLLIAILFLTQFITNETKGFTPGFVNFFSKYFALAKLADVILITDKVKVQPQIRNFCNKFVKEILDSKIVNIVVKNLNHHLDIIPDPDFEFFLNETFVLDYNFTLKQPKFERKTEKLLKNRPRFSDVEKSCVIISATFKELEIFLNGSYYLCFQRRALHSIFIVHDESKTDFKPVIQKLLLRLWTKFHILDTILHFSKKPKNLYIYRPFIKTLHSWGVVNVYNIATTNSVLNQLTNLENYPLRVKALFRFPTALDEIPKNMINDPVHTKLYQYSGFTGIDGNVLGELAKQMNFSVMLINKKQRNFGKTVKKGWVTGSLGYVVYDLIDLVANGMFVTEHENRNFEYTTLFFHDKICVIAPKAERVPQWLAIFKCFQWET